MSGEFLSLEGVSRVFTVGLFSRRQVWALKEVSLKINRGEIFALVGESGSGKTTTGRIILRLEKPSSGRVLFEGKDIFSMGKEYTKLVSVVFQDPRASLNPRMKVGQIVEEPLLVHGERDRRERVIRALTMAGLDESFLDRKPEELSGGQRQRVAIARAIVLKPRLVVADEPTSSLDMSYRKGILELFLRLKDEGMSTLLITHDMRAVQTVSDRVGVLYRGRLVESGLTSEVLRKPLHPYTQHLLNSLPATHPSQRKDAQEEYSSEESSSPCPFFHLCKYRLPACERQLREVNVDGRIVFCNLY